MRDARGVLRLKASSVSTHEIARRLDMAAFDGSGNADRLRPQASSWPLPEAMNDGALEAALYASRRSKRGHRRIEEPDWASVHRELKRKHVTLLICGTNISPPIPAATATQVPCELYRAFERRRCR